MKDEESYSNPYFKFHMVKKISWIFFINYKFLTLSTLDLTI